MLTSTNKSIWAVYFGGAIIEFDTKPEARRYVKDYQKQVEQHGGTLKAIIKRIEHQQGGNA